jgi:hypothetical protein
MIERIEEIIQEQNLKDKAKPRYLVHRRWYLFGLLRKHGIRLERIGEMFDLSHSTVIYGINQAKYYEERNDKLFLMDTLHLQNEFAGQEIIYQQRDLIEDIENCTCMYDLSLVQARIKNNQYKNHIA